MLRSGLQIFHCILIHTSISFLRAGANDIIYFVITMQQCGYCKSLHLLKNQIWLLRWINIDWLIVKPPTCFIQSEALFQIRGTLPCLLSLASCSALFYWNWRESLAFEGGALTRGGKRFWLFHDSFICWSIFIQKHVMVVVMGHCHGC